MRILHLAYEDPRQPGSGGGSVRTREINRRLSAKHQITAVVAGYRGARARVEDGVRWVPLGLHTGTKLDQLTYFALLGLAARRFASDLVVEDFGAPFSTGGAPLFTRRPVVASVQWLFARQMRAKYHLPFDWVERAGLPLYHHFVAVSEWLAQTIRQRQPGALVTAVPNGIEPLAFATQAAPPQHLLFVGRLDSEQKGCDLLPPILARIRQVLGAATPPLLIVGNGPDRPLLEQQIMHAGVGDLVRFCGRVDGAAKYRLMAQAYAVLMPSRFETFGMVAAESQAAGAPVVTFDVGPLREVAGPGGAQLVPPFDVPAFAAAAIALVQRPTLAAKVRAVGRTWARTYNWDDIAAAQEACYLQALAAGAPVRKNHAPNTAQPGEQRL